MNGRYWWVFATLLVIASSGCDRGPRIKTPSLDGRLKQAKAVAEPGLRARQLADVGERQFKAGDSEKGETTLKLAAETAATVDDPKAKSNTLIVVSKSLIAIGKGADAKPLLADAANALQVVADPDEKVTALAELGAVQGELLKEPEAALVTLKQAVEAADSIADPVLRVRAYGPIYLAFERCEQTEEAKSLLSKATEFSKSQDKPDLRTSCLIEVAGTLAKAGKHDESLHVFNDASKLAEGIKDDETRSRAFLLVAQKLRVAGRPDEARKAALKALEASVKLTDRTIRAPLEEEIHAAMR